MTTNTNGRPPEAVYIHIPFVPISAFIVILIPTFSRISRLWIISKPWIEKWS